MEAFTEHLGGALKFRAQVVAHLLVADLVDLPCYDKMKSVCRVYFWEPRSNDWFGGHAHTEGQEIYVVQLGVVEVRLSDGVNQENLALFKGDCLFIPTMLWHEVRGGAMVVMSNVEYNREKYYIGDFDLFCKNIKKFRKS